jgi:hypothetical protein
LIELAVKIQQFIHEISFGAIRPGPAVIINGDTGGMAETAIVPTFGVLGPRA